MSMCLHCLRLSALNCAEMISVVLFFFHSIEWIEFKLSRRAAICIKSQPNFHRFTIIIAFNIISKYGNIDVSKSMLDRFHKTLFFVIVELVVAQNRHFLCALTMVSV